jgi:MFS family permease
MPDRRGRALHAVATFRCFEPVWILYKRIDDDVPRAVDFRESPTPRSVPSVGEERGNDLCIAGHCPESAGRHCGAATPGTDRVPVHRAHCLRQSFNSGVDPDHGEKKLGGPAAMLMTARFWPSAGIAKRAAQWIAILYASMAGNLYIALSPMFWGGYHEYLNMSDERIGALMSAEFFGSTAATVASIFYMHRRGLDLRRIVFGAVGLSIVGNVLTPSLFDSPVGLMSVRVLCGLCAGTSYVAAAAAITGIGSPHRLVAVFYGAPFIVGTVLQPLMNPLFQHWGFAAAFELMALAAVVAVALYAYFPRQADHGEVSEGESPSDNRPWAPVGILALALLLQYVGNAGIWLYFERIGQLSGHSSQEVANVVGIGTGMSLVGTWLSAILAKRLVAADGILWGTGAMILSTASLHFAAHLPVFAGAVAVFNVMITFLTPFYFILLARSYFPAKAVIIGNICMALGFSSGPLMIRYSVHDSDFSLAINVTILLFAVSAVLVFLFQFLGGKRRDPAMGAIVR